MTPSTPQMTISLERNSRIVLASPAALVGEDREVAWAAGLIRHNPLYAWVLGRFVSAGPANANGHIFRAADLGAVNASLANAPLNYLHRPTQVLGTYVGAELVYPTDGPAKAGTPAEPPFVESLAALWRYYFPEEYATIRAFHQAGQLAQCVDEETELLSAEGWKTHDELSPGEEILTLNPTTGLSEWAVLDRVFEYACEGGDVIEIDGMMHSSVTTPNHRWWVRRKPSRSAYVWEWRTTETLTTLTRIPRAVRCADLPSLPKYTDDLVEIVAWFWTEGSVERRSTTIAQSPTANSAKCDRIRQALTRQFGLPSKRRAGGGLWYETIRASVRRFATGHTYSGPMTNFHLTAEASESLLELAPDRVPTMGFLLALTQSQLELFIRTSVSGDGHVAVADGQTMFWQKEEERIRRFEVACALAGWPTNTQLLDRSRWGHGPIYRCCVVRRSNYINPVRDAYLARKKGRSGAEVTITRRSHDGVVWCPSTANGTFLARRHGTVYWTGNSMECVPKSVTCATEGCGLEFAYAGRASDTYCAHMAPGTRGAAPRWLNKPHFSAGAIVVPPASPAWRGAQVTEVMAAKAEQLRSAEDEGLAEGLYDQVAEVLPNLSETDRETVMALLLARTGPPGARAARRTPAVPQPDMPKADQPHAHVDTDPEKTDSPCAVCGKAPDSPIHVGMGLMGSVEDGTAAMVALYPPRAVASALHAGAVLPDALAVEDMHITLAYLGPEAVLHLDRAGVAAVLGPLAGAAEPMNGTVSGVGRFSAGYPAGQDPWPLYASVDVPDLPEFRQRLVAALDAAGIPYARNHGFTPHMTIAYVGPDDETAAAHILATGVEPTPVAFGELVLAWGSDRMRFPLGAGDDAEGEGQDLSAAVAAIVARGRRAAAAIALYDPAVGRSISAEQRARMTRSGLAMADGSFPIGHTGDLRNAIKSAAKATEAAAARAHIKRRARALGASHLIPKGW